jgi:nucleoid DNA-binding protein
MDTEIAMIVAHENYLIGFVEPSPAQDQTKPNPIRSAHMQQQFFNNVARDSSLSQGQIKKVMTSIQKLTIEALKRGDTFKLPGYASVELHKKSALPERERKLFGKPVTLKAREARSCVKIVPVKKLKDQLVNA